MADSVLGFKRYVGTGEWRSAGAPFQSAVCGKNCKYVRSLPAVCRLQAIIARNDPHHEFSPSVFDAATNVSFVSCVAKARLDKGVVELHVVAAFSSGSCKQLQGIAQEVPLVICLGNVHTPLLVELRAGHEYIALANDVQALRDLVQHALRQLLVACNRAEGFACDFCICMSKSLQAYTLINYLQCRQAWLSWWAEL